MKWSSIPSNSAGTLRVGAWLLVGIITSIALAVWLQVNSGKKISGYDLFPLFGLLAFGVMWTHYIMGALRRVVNADASVLRTYFRVTGWIVLLLILLHPALSTYLLWRDGFGLPPFSYLTLYTGDLQRLALLAGAIALTAFLLFELHRWFRKKVWWRYIEYFNVIAMFLIFLHALTLGGELGVGWFRMVWYSYGVLLITALVATFYYKRRGRI